MSRCRQKGMSLIGVILLGGALAFLLLLAFKSVPAYTEYFALKRIVKQMAQGTSDSPSAIRKEYINRASIDDIRSVGPDDLEITKANGTLVIKAEYERRVPVIANVFLLFEFSVDSGSL